MLYRLQLKMQPVQVILASRVTQGATSPCELQKVAILRMRLHAIVMYIHVGHDEWPT